jgi:hypothetical protein
VTGQCRNCQQSAERSATGSAEGSAH